MAPAGSACHAQNQCSTLLSAFTRLQNPVAGLILTLNLDSGEYKDASSFGGNLYDALRILNGTVVASSIIIASSVPGGAVIMGEAGATVPISLKLAGNCAVDGLQVIEFVVNNDLVVTERCVAVVCQGHTGCRSMAWSAPTEWERIMRLIDNDSVSPEDVARVVEGHHY